MNTWQVLQQFKYALKSRNWAGGSTPVFHDDAIRITDTAPAEYAGRLINPIAFIWPLDASVDPMQGGQEPGLIYQNINVRIIQKNDGDQFGENALIGANRTGLTDSRGRGLLEIEEEVFTALQDLNDADGIRIISSARSMTQAGSDQEPSSLRFRDYTFLCICTNARFYHGGYNFVATGGVGQIVCTWGLPPDRFDRYRMVVRRSAAGGAAPASITAGVSVPLASNLATSVTPTGLAAGTYALSLFASYDITNVTAAQDDEQSAALSRSSVVVT